MLPESECKGRDFLRNGKRLEDFFEKNMRFSLIQWDGGQIMGVLCRQRNVALRGKAVYITLRAERKNRENREKQEK